MELVARFVLMRAKRARPASLSVRARSSWSPMGSATARGGATTKAFTGGASGTVMSTKPPLGRPLTRTSPPCAIVALLSTPAEWSCYVAFAARFSR